MPFDTTGHAAVRNSRCGHFYCLECGTAASTSRARLCVFCGTALQIPLETLSLKELAELIARSVPPSVPPPAPAPKADSLCDVCHMNALLTAPPFFQCGTCGDEHSIVRPSDIISLVTDAEPDDVVRALQPRQFATRMCGIATLLGQLASSPGMFLDSAESLTAELLVPKLEHKREELLKQYNPDENGRPGPAPSPPIVPSDRSHAGSSLVPPQAPLTLPSSLSLSAFIPPSAAASSSSSSSSTAPATGQPSATTPVPEVQLPIDERYGCSRVIDDVLVTLATDPELGVTTVLTPRIMKKKHARTRAVVDRHQFLSNNTADCAFPRDCELVITVTAHSSDRPLLPPHEHPDDVLIRVSVNPSSQKSASIAARVSPRADDPRTVDFILHMLQPGVRAVHVDILVAGAPVWWGPFQVYAGPTTATLTGRGELHPAFNDLASDGIACSPDGQYVVVCSSSRHHLSVYMLATGTLLRRIGGPFSGQDNRSFRYPRHVCFSVYPAQASSSSSSSSTALTVVSGGAPHSSDPVPNVLVVDGGNNRVQEVSISGAYVRTIGADVLVSPWGVAASAQFIVVSEHLIDRVTVFRASDGQLWVRCGGSGKGPGDLSAPTGVRVLTGWTGVVTGTAPPGTKVPDWKTKMAQTGTAVRLAVLRRVHGVCHVVVVVVGAVGFALLGNVVFSPCRMLSRLSVRRRRATAKYSVVVVHHQDDGLEERARDAARVDSKPAVVDRVGRWRSSARRTGRVLQA